MWNSDRSYYLWDDKYAKEKAYKVNKARETAKQMLQDRGYIIVEDEEKRNRAIRSNEDYPYHIYGIRIIDANMSADNIVNDNMADHILVFFPEEELIGVLTIKQIAITLYKLEIYRAIIIMKHGHSLTPFAARVIEKLKKYCYIEPFSIMELQYNVTKHKLVPKHEILSNEDKMNLFKKYRLSSEKQLPKIQHEDAVARYFGAKPGQVLKITRPSETAGRYVTYRIVV